MKFEDLKDELERTWTDISSEKNRVYRFSDSLVRIDYPIALCVSDSGSHRILDNNGISHYIPSGYIHLSWETKEGKPHFVK